MSPLGGWTQEQLLEHGYRGASRRPLWHHLRDTADPFVAQTVESLREIMRRHEFASRCGAILLSPVFGDPELPRKIASWMLEDKLPARLQLQIHKLVWPPGERRR